jgi:hypothetical protein
MNRDKRIPAVNGALGMIVLLVVAQMWLVTATLESYLAGHRGPAVPGAVVSGVLFAACGALALFIGGVDRKAREDRERP